MQKYGKMVDGNLLLSSEQLEGYKPVEYAVVPEFDQTLYYVKQGMVIEYDDRISIGAEMVKVEIQEQPVEVDPPSEFVANPPWKDETKEEKRLSLLEDAVLILMME